MKWFNLKNMSKHFDLSYSTIRYYNSFGNKKYERIVQLLLLTFFVEKVEIDKKDIECLQHFFQKKKSVREEIEIDKTMKELNDKYWNIDLESLRLGKELYLLSLSREDLKTIYRLKNNKEVENE